MQKATSDITILHFFLPISAYISEANHTSITPRSKVHGTLQINQSNFLNFENYPYDKGKPWVIRGRKVIESIGHTRN